MRWIAAISLFLALAINAQAQTPATPGQQKIDELIRLLQDPEVQSLLEARKSQPASAPPEEMLFAWKAAMRARFDATLAALPRIPAEVGAAAARTRQDALSAGYAPVFLILLCLLAAGVIAERLYLRARTGAGTLTTKLLSLAVFTFSMGLIFFTLRWPPLTEATLMLTLAGIIAFRAAAIAIDFAVARPEIRRRIRLFLGVLFLAIASAMLGKPIGIDPAVSRAISWCFSLVLVILAIEGVVSGVAMSLKARLAIVLSVLILWVLWSIGLTGLFLIGVYLLLLPPLLKVVGNAAETASSAEPRSVRQVLFVRGSRAIVLLLAVASLAAVSRTSTTSLIAGNPAAQAIAYGLLKSVIVLLLADLVWHLSRAWIDRLLASAPEGVAPSPAESARRARVRTLLPIFRNMLAVLVAVMAALIVLAQLGVEIGPLIAGAGIFGVALGFGSQTLVKDVISGVFYMLDDAFRVGEYIQSGSYKGTVEGFSLRSVRLRHHRGPVFTVPFGALGAVENMSRDWVIDKFRISVGFDTDINKARKIAKAIGAELQADPEVGPMFIEPLKMKGVEEFGDYGIVLSFAMTTVPGQQTYIRRKAYLMIREAFKAAGIAFATPSVQIGGDDKTAAAAAMLATRDRQERSATGTEG
ncbi:mechanosensitive ion channel family protein [Rhizobium hidalgonense]|uniref:mechanosensitive ion channel family protein n=1 Tax=Rhizobium hidalgonense TaxID=1538159 RepID=UPI000FEC6882|nr:mechanosensitive ion channel family protein [Rhizobium hidalgonense]RWX17785.1 mechanosensitive ion channel family protein [Rhizobium hidalgonense]